ncbi:response regulator [Candidatus Paracaedibacter symbiosus]|uniref:response regulator n=1 Tax=Candidatus Paracaedibacter symbiosus TaxID=244582 RepID=UPI00068ADCA9|nr:response regulator [Candidatus Paracaedibacter symbiosus]
MRFFPSVLVFIAALIWASAFIYLSLNVQDILEGFSLLAIGTISSFVLAYWARLIHRNQRLYERFRFLQTGIASLAPTIESVIFDNTGKIVWTTHPNAYPNLTEFSRKLFLRIKSSEKTAEIQRVIDQRERCDILFCGGGNGLGQDQKWWTFSQAPFDKNSSIIIVKDVTTHFDTYHHLKHNYQQLEKFLDEAPFAIFYTSGQGKILGVNQTFCQWLELSQDQCLGRNITDFLKESDGYKGLVKVVNKNGPSFKALLFKPTIAPQTRLRPSILCKFETPIALVHEEILTESAFIDAAIPAVTLNHLGTITSSNSAFNAILGENYVKREFAHLVHPGQREEVARKLQKAFDQRSPILPFEIRLDHNKLQATVYASRPYQKGYHQEVMLQFIDISEQKRLEDQFIQSQKMQAVGQLAGGIAHDFNNLLTAMIGYSDLLLQRYLPNDPSYTDVMQIKQNANRAANLVRQLLAFSRRQTLQPKVVNITDHLVEISTLLRRLIGAGIELKMSHARDLWPVKVDIGQFEQVIINLVVNARDAMKGGGTLTIKTLNHQFLKQQRHGHDLIPKGEYISIEVIDTGHGIAPENLPYIFEPFFSTKEVGEGTGLGLSTVYGIVKQTGGFVLVDSQVNQGTTFNILLPRYVGAIEDETIKVDQQISDLTGGGKVLLVEDEDAVRMFSARALREKGYEVIEAASGDAALDLVKGGQEFDILVTDVVMPKMDGPTLCKKIRDIHPNARTIFISGYTEDTFRKNLDSDANIHFLPKPFTLKDLALKVKEVLGSES